jgi:hypothetical protein
MFDALRHGGSLRPLGNHDSARSPAGESVRRVPRSIGEASENRGDRVSAHYAVKILRGGQENQDSRFAMSAGEAIEIIDGHMRSFRQAMEEGTAPATFRRSIGDTPSASALPGRGCAGRRTRARLASPPLPAHLSCAFHVTFGRRVSRVTARK